MQKELVTIITPCYNSSQTISEAIESVINQTYKNWEMLIINDCSTDNSAAIVIKYSQQDCRIKLLNTSNPSGSPSLPRNIGIDNAQGEYIAFLDSDDIWLPNKLEEQISYLRENNLNFVYSNYEKINYSGKRNNRIIKLRSASSFWDTIESCSIPCLTVLLRKDIVRDNRFIQSPKEDFVFWLQLHKQGNTAYNTGITHALYRESNTSRSSNKFNMFKNQWYVLRKIEGVNKIPALYFMIIFTIKGFMKFIK